MARKLTRHAISPYSSQKKAKAGCLHPVSTSASCTRSTVNGAFSDVSCCMTTTTAWTASDATHLSVVLRQYIGRFDNTPEPLQDDRMEGIGSMKKLTDYTSYADAQREFSTARLWELFDGNRETFNIAHECVDRHTRGNRVALRVAHADGADEIITFSELSAWSSRFAHWMVAFGVTAGDRVAIMLEPSLPFYAALFGAMKAGAIAVPLFTLFGADGVWLRTHDCTPRLLLTTPEKAEALTDLDTTRTVAVDDALLATVRAQDDCFLPRTTSSDMAIYQYTSGTTRELPAAIRHTHRALVVVM